MELIESYHLAVIALGALATLLFVQLLIADVIGILNKHIPGAVIVSDHKSLLFRATRTVANSNESIAIFLLALAFCVFSGASAEHTGYAALAFVASRAAYALCYYFDFRILRSTVFAISLLMLAALIGIGAFT